MSYAKLKKTWYAKLKAEGFNDIEKNEDQLKKSSSRFAEKRSVLSWEAKSMYYTLATRFLNEHKFETRREEIIWEYHTQGISIRNIVKLLKKVRIKTYRRAVWNTVDKLRTAMYDKYKVSK